MKILVPIKRVIDPYAKVRALPDGLGIDLSSVEFAVNPFDEIALEEAVRLKENDPATEIVVVTIGTSESEQQLRKMLAMGADRAILIETTNPFEPKAVAVELAALVRQEQPDLVLMGKQATDDDSNQVGQMLAAYLDWPQATFAARVSLFGRILEVTRETDSGEETLEMDLPAVVTTDLRLNEPRYIGMAGIVKARSKPLERRAPSTQSEPTRRVLQVTAPAARVAGRRVGSVDELVAALRAGGSL
ncbi:MAG: electron transfer flavoprotein subunit beta/FixA family protein [Fimbriimonas sp.]